MKTTLITKLIVPAMLVGSLVFLGNTNIVRPEKKEKSSSEKTATTTVSAEQNTLTIDYLKYILPKAVYEVSKIETAQYRKDANGVYRLVVNEGC